MFPRNDKVTRKWILGEWILGEWILGECALADNAVAVDTEILNCDRVQGEERRADAYEFWRDELLTLRDILEKPRLTSIVQFWYDRWNKVQWYTLWIAVLILCLTVFSGLSKASRALCKSTRHIIPVCEATHQHTL
jgi:hypothetical protein